MKVAETLSTQKKDAKPESVWPTISGNSLTQAIDFNYMDVQMMGAFQTRNGDLFLGVQKERTKSNETWVLSVKANLDIWGEAGPLTFKNLDNNTTADETSDGLSLLFEQKETKLETSSQRDQPNRTCWLVLT